MAFPTPPALDEPMITTVQTRSRMPDRLNFPYGGELIDLSVSPERAFELKAESRHSPSWNLSARQLCDEGAESQLRVFSSSRILVALMAWVWPIPVMLDVSEEFA